MLINTNVHNDASRYGTKSFKRNTNRNQEKYIEDEQLAHDQEHINSIQKETKDLWITKEVDKTINDMEIEEINFEGLEFKALEIQKNFMAITNQILYLHNLLIEIVF